MENKLYRWVKASERLPEKDGAYAIKDSEHAYLKISEMYYCEKSPTKWHFLNSRGQKTENVIIDKTHIIEWLEPLPEINQEEAWNELISKKENELKKWKSPTMVDGSTHNNYDIFSKEAIPKLTIEISQLKGLSSKYILIKR